MNLSVVIVSSMLASRGLVRYSAFNATPVFGENLLRHVRSRITSSAPFRARARTHTPCAFVLSFSHSTYKHTRVHNVFSPRLSLSHGVVTSAFGHLLLLSLMQTREPVRAKHSACHVIGTSLALCICKAIDVRKASESKFRRFLRRFACTSRASSSGNDDHVTTLASLHLHLHHLRG